MSIKQFLKLFSTSLVSIDDEALMMMVLENNTEAFDELYNRYKVSIYSYLYRSVDKQIAEELLQEIFIKLIRYKASFKFNSKFKTWFWVIARNTLIDYYRSVDHQMKNSFDSIIDENGEESLTVELSSSEEALIKKTERKQLEICFKELNDDQREAMLLSIQGELSNAEIAQVMNVSIGAVKSMHFRAKEKLLKCFKDGGHI